MHNFLNNHARLLKQPMVNCTQGVLLNFFIKFQKNIISKTNQYLHFPRLFFHKHSTIHLCFPFALYNPSMNYNEFITTLSNF